MSHSEEGCDFEVPHHAVSTAPTQSPRSPEWKPRGVSPLRNAWVPFITPPSPGSALGRRASVGERLAQSGIPHTAAISLPVCSTLQLLGLLSQRRPSVPAEFTKWEIPVGRGLFFFLTSFLFTQDLDMHPAHCRCPIHVC